MAQPIVSLTDAAAEQVKFLIKKREKPTLGIRVKVKSGGCSGLSYVFEYADAKEKLDEEIEDKGAKVFIDSRAVMYLIGSVMDYIDEDTKSGFAFVNPNEKGKCGCGQSFNI